MVFVFKVTAENVKKRFINVYKKIFKKENKTYSFYIKSYTNVLSEHVFAQSKELLKSVPSKTITMKSAEIFAAHNKTNCLFERMTNDEFNEFFKNHSKVTKLLKNDLKISRKILLKEK
uniref:Uncharacterized protein n=1 Tax=Strongyloides stercoralis TaxID=6248 RepID=A0A0K0EC17_STRER